MTDIIVMENLAPAEQDELQKLEAIVEQGLQTFFEVGNALMEIRDKRLYRQSHKTFEDYVNERWDFSRYYAHRLISAASVVQNLLPIGNKIPETESQARPLTGLPAGQQQKAWQKAVDNAGGQTPTAAQVKAAVDDVKGKPKFAEGRFKTVKVYPVDGQQKIIYDDPLDWKDIHQGQAKNWYPSCVWYEGHVLNSQAEAANKFTVKLPARKTLLAADKFYPCDTANRIYFDDPHDNETRRPQYRANWTMIRGATLEKFGYFRNSPLPAPATAEPTVSNDDYAFDLALVKVPAGQELELNEAYDVAAALFMKDRWDGETPITIIDAKAIYDLFNLGIGDAGELLCENGCYSWPGDQVEAPAQPTVAPEESPTLGRWFKPGMAAICPGCRKAYGKQEPYPYERWIEQDNFWRCPERHRVSEQILLRHNKANWLPEELTAKQPHLAQQHFSDLVKIEGRLDQGAIDRATVVAHALLEADIWSGDLPVFIDGYAIHHALNRYSPAPVKLENLIIEKDKSGLFYTVREPQPIPPAEDAPLLDLGDEYHFVNKRDRRIGKAAAKLHTVDHYEARQIVKAVHELLIQLDTMTTRARVAYAQLESIGYIEEKGGWVYKPSRKRSK